MNEILAQHKRRRGTTETKEKELKPAHFTYLKDQGGFGWLWGRRVLIIGDSVDRFMVQFFCQEFGRTDQQPEPRTTATCEIPTFNLTIIQWHFSGSFTYRPDWWWMEDMKEVAFEERWDTWWSKTLDSQVRGLNGRAPDLLLWQSGLWDQRAFWEGGAAHNKTAGMGTMGEHQRQLVWEEARFVTVRLKKLLRVLRDEFGDIPSMFRTVSLHKNSNAEDANLMELDRIQRSIAEQQGHEIFEWGRILSSFTMLYRDKTHTDKGPGSWLWGNMMLEYLRRSAGSVSAWHDEEQSYFDNWALCHSRLISWGGR